MKKIVFLVSGNGGNLKFFDLACRKGFIENIQLTAVADRECGAVQFARDRGIPNHVISYTRSDNRALLEILNEVSPDFVITNWHKIIDKDTVAAYAGRLVNLHYSLLPAFSGLIGTEPIKRAIEQGCKFIGPSCHLVDEGVDTGKILAQGVFKLNMPLDGAVQAMFQTGCLVLLNGLCQLDADFCERHDSAAASQCFHPDLVFDSGEFTNDFWMELSRA